MLKMDLNASIDQLEQQVLAKETQIARLRQEQAELIHQLDMRHVHRVDGARSMQEWTRGRLDVSAQTARNLVDAARHLPQQPELADNSEDLSFERLVATSRLWASGADAATLKRSFGFDLAGVDRLRSRHRRITRSNELDRFLDRFVFFQDSLDNTTGKIHGELPGFEYAVIRDAVEERADQFGDLPGPTQNAPRRRADALVAICQDSREPMALDGEPPQRSEPLITVFFDADKARSRGETGAEIEFGPRVGPAVLERILCEGRIQLVGLDHGKPVVTSDRTRAIAPEVRRFVRWRDSGCTIAGCHSRYRLQPHHVWHRDRLSLASAKLKPDRRSGGDNDPANLTTLCWFHHHSSCMAWGSGSTPTHRRRSEPSSATWRAVSTPCRYQCSTPLLTSSPTH
jgi:hypothetical protein